jgi:hypothetical protein
MSVGCTPCVQFFIILFSINSQKLFEVVATAGIAATLHVLTHPSWEVPGAARILASHLILFCYHRSNINETLEVTPKEDVKPGQFKV